NFGHQVEKAAGSCSSPTVRMTMAVLRVWPALTIPRSSSLSLRNVSASSRISVGRYFSIDLKHAAGEMCEPGSARLVGGAINWRSVVLPQRIVGLLATRRGEIDHASMR